LSVLKNDPVGEDAVEEFSPAEIDRLKAVHFQPKEQVRVPGISWS
jgi:hypothetical protein